MTQKEILESVLLELSLIKKGMPNGELKQLADTVKDMKKDISELKYMLMNPEDGVIVKVNKNTDFRRQEERQSNVYFKQLQELEELKRWKDNVSKALWILFTALAGIAVKVIFFTG